MQLAHEKISQVLVVKPLETRIVGVVSTEFKQAMAAFIDEGQEAIVLDLSEVDLMDSTGLGAIFASLKMLRGKGDLVVAGASGKVMSLFKITEMDQIFRIFANRDDAVGALLASRR
jgi:anti-sigma B factor antagonist